MTCQHCQTWNLDDDHRCRRCGRRTKGSPARISPDTYPIAATATARAYDFEEEFEAAPQRSADSVAGAPVSAPQLQQPLFAVQPDPRVIQFDAFTSPANRESIRARAAELSNAARRQGGRPRKEGRRLDSRTHQQLLDFHGQSVGAVPAAANIPTDALIAPASLRLQAVAIDAAMIVAAWIAGALVFRAAGGSIVFDKHTALCLLPVLASVPVLYTFLWAMAARDTVGIRAAGLRIIDFDGNRPSRERRFQRVIGSFISLLAAGLGLLWIFVDPDGLTWQDHISSTLPTIDD